jgi:hypothetical protein
VVFAGDSAFLGCQVPHLCKSIVVENTACTNAGMDDPRNSKCGPQRVLIVVCSHAGADRE